MYIYIFVYIYNIENAEDINGVKPGDRIKYYILFKQVMNNNELYGVILLKGI